MKNKKNKVKDTDRKALVEKIGVLASKSGFTPAIGRILGYLLISEPPHKSFEDIQEDLKLSKSAVSNALNMLISMKIIDYITKHGERKRYFGINLDNWYSMVKAKISSQEAWFDMITEAISVRSDESPGFNNKLNEMLEFNIFINKEIKSAIDRWEKRKR